MTATTVYTPSTGTAEEPSGVPASVPAEVLGSVPPGTPASEPPPLRLSLAPAGSSPARIDGAWWPRSRDLAAELPALTDVLDKRWDRVTRVTVNPVHWPVIPHKVQVNGHVVKVGWFKDEQDPDQLMLLSYDTGRWDLLVVPPETPADTAEWLMAAAADPLRTSTGSQLREEAARVG